MLSTTLRKLYMICDERVRVEGFSREFLTTKVVRLLDVLREYKPEMKHEPEEPVDHQFNNREDPNFVSWYQDEDAEKDDEFDEPQVPTPFTNRLWGCLLVNERPVARYLVKIIKDAGKNDTDLQHVCAQALCQMSRLGVDTVDSQVQVEERKKQEEALHKFRTREANLLIAQAETGTAHHKTFDIPKCNLVLRFDPPTTYIKYDGGKRLLSQSSDSLHGILVDKLFKDSFYEKLKNFKTLEEYLITRNLKSEEPGPIELCLDLGQEHEGFDPLLNVVFDEGDQSNTESNPKYTMTTEQSRSGWRRRERPLIELNLENSLGLLNKYCNRLPCDTFTQLSVLKKTDELPCGKFQTSLVLPNNSHLRGIIQGEPEETEPLSKQSAALAACQKLRLAGELDDFLFHTGKEIEKYRIETDPFPVTSDYQRQKNKAPGPEGGPKRRQLYNRHVPKCFRQKIKNDPESNSGLPLPEKAAYVYRISMFFRHGIQDKYNYRGRRLHRPEDAPRSFGIISGMPIPHTLPSFSIFDRSGEEGVHLEPVHQMITFSQAHIEMFRSFHQYIFQDVIRIERPGGCVQFSPEKSPLPYLVVPLTCDNSTDWTVDWDFLVGSLADRTRCEQANDSERRVRQFSEVSPYVFRKSEVNDAVVIASYRRHDSPNQNRFYVAEIQYDMDPDSPFPSDDYKSFRQVSFN